MVFSFFRVINLFVVVFFTLSSISCSSGSSSSSSSSDFSDLSYSEAVSLYSTKGLSATEISGDLALSHNTFLNTDTDNDAIATVETNLNSFVDDLSTYTQLLEDLNDLEDIAFDVSSSSLVKQEILYQSVDPSGVDSVNSLTDTMLAKKSECDALFALVPSLPTTTADFEKLTAAQLCAREAQILAIQNGFDAAVVSGAGGVVGGAAGGAAVIYLGGTVLSGGGLLVVTVTGFVGSRIASYIWSSCTSSSTSNLKNILQATTDSDICAFNSGSGSTDSALVMQAIGTGNLQIFVEDCAPVKLSGLTITSGQTLSVSATCEEIDDDIDASTVNDASDSASSSAGDSEAVACADIQGIVASNSPSDPSPSDIVTVTVTTIPPASDCSVLYAMSGTDGYSQSETLSSSSSGGVSFTIPAAGQEDVVDTINISEGASSQSTVITYVF